MKNLTFSKVSMSVAVLALLAVVGLAGCGGGGGGGGNGNSGSSTTETTNSVPQIVSVPESYAKENVAYTYQVSAIDANNDTLTYSLTTAPSGMTINASTGLISWTPTSSQGGQLSAVVSVSDSKDSVTQTYNVQVETATVAATQSISASTGGTVAVTDPTSPIYGAKISIPAGTLTSDAVVSIIQHTNASYVPEGAIVVGFTVSGQSVSAASTPLRTKNKARASESSQTVQVDIPYSQSFIDTYGIQESLGQLSLYVWDATKNVWKKATDVTITAVEATANIITVSELVIPYGAVASYEFLVHGTTPGIINLSQSNTLLEVKKDSLNDFWSNSAGKNLLIIHGILSSEESFAASDDFIEYFKANGDYTNILFYNYPSGKSITSNASWLATEILKNNKDVSFDIVAHSMGGLVARCLIERCYTPDTSTYDLLKVNVDHLFMVGTPNFGAPSALVLLEMPGINNDISYIYPGLSDLSTTSDFFTKTLNYPTSSDVIARRGSSSKYYWFTGNDGNSYKDQCEVLGTNESDGVVCVPTSYDISYLGLDSTTAKTFGPTGTDPPYAHSKLHEKCATNGICDEIINVLSNPTPSVSSFNINSDASSTTARTVTLNNTATGSPTQYMASESSTFSGANWQTYSTAPSFTLSSGNATKTVYFKVKNSTGESTVVSDSISLNEATTSQYTLAVSKSGTGSGTVTSSTGGISCGSTCSDSYNSGASVTLTASASSGSTFAGWSGGGCSGTGTCTVTMNVATTVTATFTATSAATPPTAPSGLVALTASTFMSLAWNDNSSDETGFKVERKTGVSGSWSQIASVGQNIAAYLDYGVSAGITYYYRVFAYNSSGVSGYSNEAFATILGIDTTPPTVSSTSPANKATGVAVNTAITATFSETMTASTVSTTTFTLNNGVTGTVTYSGTTATFTPSSNLAYSTTYTATITTGVKDSAGNAMAAAYTWTFTTGATTTPSAGQITVSPSSLNFGSVPVGSCGSAIFAIQSVSGSASGTVNVSPNPPFSIYLGSSFTVSNGSAANVSIQFCPTSASSYSGTAAITSNATFTGVSSVALSGTATPIVNQLTITTSSLAGGVINAGYNASLGASGGTPPYAWSLVQGTQLPQGLSLSNTGVISGTPITPGTASFQAQVTDSAQPSQTVQKLLSISIVGTPPGQLTMSAVNECSAATPQVRLTWTQASSVDYYQVYKDGSVLTGVSTTLPSYLDTSVALGSTYAYFIRAVNTGGTTDSNTANLSVSCVTPPGQFTLSAVTSCSGTSPVNVLNLTGSAGVVLPYSVYRDGTLLTSLSTSGFSDTAVTPGTSYTYLATASNSVGSTNSNSVLISTAANCAVPVNPSITSMSPQTATVGGGAFTLTVTGSNFDSSSKILWDPSGGTPSTQLPTNFVDSTTLTATINQTTSGFSPFTWAGTYMVQVMNTATSVTNGPRSNTVNLAVYNPMPTISSVSGSCRANLNCTPANGYDVRINGNGFVNNSTTSYVYSTFLQVNGANANMSIVGQGPVYNQLQLMVNGSLIPSSGTYTINVCNEGTIQGRACASGSLSVSP